MKGIKRWIVIVVASMIVLLTLFGILLWRLGLFEFTGADASAKIIAATLALIGGLIGSVVTIVGIFLKHSLDQRNAELREQEERRLQIESERNINLREEAEKRLKLETAIQAVQLLSTSSGKDVPLTQRAGVLFTLANLGQADLAINIASQMINNGKIDAGTVEWLINHALQSNDNTTQEEACSLLAEVADTIFIREEEEKLSIHLPACLEEWNHELTLHVRERGVRAYVKQMLSRPYSKWEWTQIENFITCLGTYWKNEEDEYLKNGVGICLEKILDIYEFPVDRDIRLGNGEVLGIHMIKRSVRGLNERVESINIFTHFVPLSKQIEEWGST